MDDGKVVTGDPAKVTDTVAFPVNPAPTRVTKVPTGPFTGEIEIKGVTVKAAVEVFPSASVAEITYDPRGRFGIVMV